MWQRGDVQSGVAFGPFRLDSSSAQLHRGKDVVPLRPEALAVLQYLLERRGPLVETAALIAAVWPDAVPGGAALRACVGELRRALADPARASLYIETVPRRGYRFVAKLAAQRAPKLARKRSAASSHTPAIVGRGQELAALQAAWGRALAGHRQIVSVSGEAGIGKTALLEAFLAANKRALAGVWVARGQCVEQYGPGEPFLPILEGLGRLCQAPGGARIVGL